MATKSRSGTARKKAATAKANKGKTGGQIAGSRANTINTYSKKPSATASKSTSPRKKSRAKSRANVSNRPKRGLAG